MQMQEHRDEAMGFAVRAVDIDGEPWFMAKDICDALEIENSRNAVDRLDDDEKGVRQADTLGGPQEMQCVNESGLYTLILRSNKPKAREFRRWVTHEVLPTIRRTGSYALVAAESAPPMPLEHPVTQFLRTVDALRERGVAPIRALYAVGNLFQSAVSSAMNTRLAIMAPVFIAAPKSGMPALEEGRRKQDTRSETARSDGRLPIAKWAQMRGLKLTTAKKNGFGRRVAYAAEAAGVEQTRVFGDSGPLNVWPPEFMDTVWARMNKEGGAS